MPFPVLAERFRVVEEYTGGEGWSGAVRPVEGGELRVLKVLHPWAELTEVSLLASLRHPRVPRVLETGHLPDSRAFLVREHLAGTPLQTGFPMNPSEVVELATQLLEVLAYVHLRGILHLDLKPANILRQEDGGVTRFFLLDFGLGARRRDTGRGGTPFFAAPERLLGLPADARSDLFSLGALLYSALPPEIAPVGMSRFLTRFPDLRFFAALDVDPAGLPEPFDCFLPRLVSRRPGARFPDAQEALEAIAGRSGRPSLALLRPDAIAIHGDAVLRCLSTGEDLCIRGEDADVRHSLALHAAVELGGVGEIVVDAEHDAVVVCRGGAGPAVFDIPSLDEESLARHLADAVELDARAARGAARHLLANNKSITAIDTRLTALVETGAIAPDGTRWIWPDAVSGRIELRPDLPPERLEPAALRDAAARGQVERALAAYRTIAPECDRDRDLACRAALVEGLVLAGEPARCLPFVADLPVHHARSLLDLGQPSSALALLESVAHRSAADLHTTEPDRQRLLATIDHVRGRRQQSLDRLTPLAGGDASPALEIILSQVLASLGRFQPAMARLEPLVEKLREADQPFLLAAALTSMAECQRAEGDLAGAGNNYRLAQQLLMSVGHVRHSATAATNLGVIAKDLGQFQEALDCQRRARAMYEHVGDRRGVALAEANHGIVNLAMGDPTGALRRLRSAFDQFEALGARQHHDLLMVRMAEAHAQLGEADAARGCLERAGSDLGGRLAEDAARVGTGLPERSGLVPDAVSGDDVVRDMQDLPTEPVTRGVPKEVFRTFLAVNRRLAAEADLDRAMNYLLDAAVTLTGGRTGYLLVVRGDGLRLELRCGDANEAAVAFSRSMVNRAVQQRRTQTAEDALADRELVDMSSVQNLRQRSAICAPFRSAGGHEGALYVEHPTRAGVFKDAEKEHLEILADQASIAVDRMLHEEALTRELEQSRHDLVVARRALPSGKVTMLGKSPPMRALRKQIERVAGSELAVLIRGETGSGKELVARAMHHHSGRNRGPFVAENCSAIPENLMESEFFGHCKGAFTGAEEDRAGLLEAATGGTLFLDEIGDMPAALQVKLLRALQESAVRRVGGTRSIPIDIRLVSATHKDLRAEIEAGTFREDLFFRIAAVDVVVPPLRERGEDILLLAESFLAELNREHRRSLALGVSAIEALLAYPWPGNVRELHHVISRGFILADGDDLDDLQLPARRDGPSASLEGVGGEWPVVPLHIAEARTIEAALRSTGGDKAKAARVLGISRTAIYEKLRRIKAREGE